MHPVDTIHQLEVKLQDKQDFPSIHPISGEYETSYKGTGRNCQASSVTPLTPCTNSWFDQQGKNNHDQFQGNNSTLRSLPIGSNINVPSLIIPCVTPSKRLNPHFPMNYWQWLTSMVTSRTNDKTSPRSPAHHIRVPEGNIISTCLHLLVINDLLSNLFILLFFNRFHHNHIQEPGTLLLNRAK